VNVNLDGSYQVCNYSDYTYSINGYSTMTQTVNNGWYVIASDSATNTEYTSRFCEVRRHARG
jgi:uncharacterized membrane protein